MKNTLLFIIKLTVNMDKIQKSESTIEKPAKNPVGHPRKITPALHDEPHERIRARPITRSQRK